MPVESSSESLRSPYNPASQLSSRLWPFHPLILNYWHPRGHPFKIQRLPLCGLAVAPYGNLPGKMTRSGSPRCRSRNDFTEPKWLPRKIQEWKFLSFSAVTVMDRSPALDLPVLAFTESISYLVKPCRLSGEEMHQERNSPTLTFTEHHAEPKTFLLTEGRSKIAYNSRGESTRYAEAS